MCGYYDYDGLWSFLMGGNWGLGCISMLRGMGWAAVALLWHIFFLLSFSSLGGIIDV